MKTVAWLAVVLIAAGTVSQGRAHDSDSQLTDSLQKYDMASAKRDVETVKSLLAPEILVYEHSVRNDGLQDAFENHLKPEILESEGLQLDYSDVRITAGTDLALVTRQYKIHGKVQEKEINAGGNETMVWQRKGADWKIVHLHYSHPCPRASSSK